MQMSNKNRSLALVGVELASGFYEPESDHLGCFVWAQSCFRVRRLSQERYLVLHLCYNGRCGKLTLKQDGAPAHTIVLCQGWNHYAADLSGTKAEEIGFEVSPVVRVSDDARDLGVMIRAIELTDNRAEVQRLARISENKALNQREFADGKTVLESYPVGLRIDVEPRCNMKPPCVYCQWDWARHLESQSDFVFTLDTLAELGGFYECAEDIVDCSVGEFFLSDKAGTLLERFHRSRKHLDVTTNGILLDQEIRARLLGKDVTCYFSIDSATAAGYARYRDDRFDTVIKNLRCLCREKAGCGNRPLVMVAFIAMSSNRHELPRLLALMRDVGVDGVKLRSLSVGGPLDHQAFRRAGLVFDYSAEVLSLCEIRHLADQAREVAGRIGINLQVDLDFGNAEAAAGGPICSEPWRTSYVLTRGIQPCTFGTLARQCIATWSERGDRPLAAFVSDAFNGSAMQKMRAQLARGDLPRFCRDCPTCPIVRKRMDPEK